MTDMINPDHYKGDRRFEPIDVIEDWGLNYRLGNALKYISRNGRKPGEDPREGLKKAIWYLQREIYSLESPSGSYVPDEDGLYDELLDYYGQSLDEEEAWPELDDEKNTLHLDFGHFGNIFLADEKDYDDFWNSEDALWDPSVGPVELSEDEISSVLSRKALDQFEDVEIVSTIEKRGMIIGVRKDGSTCLMNSRGICE